MSFRIAFAALGALALAVCIGAAHAGTVVQVPTRENVTVSLYWSPVERASATVLLLPGGNGGFGRVEAGGPTSRNFLVRSAALFEARGLNVAIFGRPSDGRELSYAERTSEAHVTDITRVVQHLRRQSPAPLWLVGTSRGTISAAAAAIHAPTGIDGVVFSASITNLRREGALPAQALDAIRVPALVVHHARDACPACTPYDAPRILRALTRAPVKKLLWLDGGGPAEGDPCEALHHHGFIGIEAQAVNAMADWIARPVP